MRKRLMLCNVAIIIVGFLVSFVLATVLVQQQYKNEFTKRLDATLTVLATKTDEIKANPDSYAEQVSAELQKTDQQMRISIIALDGTVLGDSEKEDINQNHLNRPEIQQALKNGRGYDIRASQSIQTPFYYAAVYLKGQFFIRAALPLADLDSVIKKLWLFDFFSMLLGIALVYAATWWFVGRISKPLNELTQVTEKIADGDYSSRVSEEYQDEIGELARSFNRMSDSTQNAFSQLQSKQNQLEGVLQGMDDGVLAVNHKNEILFFNQSASSLLNCASLCEGKQFDGNLLIGKISNLMKQAIEQDGTLHETVTVGSSNEKQFTVYAAPIEDPASKAALAVIRDVTRVRKLEQLRSEFVANVTHELKTPLTSIRGSIELLKSADRDEETRRYFYDILDIEAERLHHLIDDMLVLSQIENAKEDPSVSRCNVREKLEDTVKRLKPVAEKCKVTMELDADSTLFVACSPTRLEQLFGNLIENAIKYNKENGQVSITARGQRQMAIIRIKDTGIGIAPEHIDRLFERFYRVDTSRSRAIGGTGLGLSIVKHLASLYNGEVSVESTVGVGSTFTIRLPLMQAESEAERVQ